ncbi:MAG: MarR family transcriptional regulator [Pseudomonadota bacterium]|nr:MarR family transcriptional regulator [Pseudomonadota bacterium]
MSNDERLIYLLSITQQALKDYTNRMLANKGGTVTLAQAGILFLLNKKDGQYMSELGQVIGVDSSAMTRLVDRLEKAGLVKRRIDPENRRAISILLTPAGRQEATAALTVIKRINKEIKEDYSPEELNAFKKVLSGILDKYGKR